MQKKTKMIQFDEAYKIVMDSAREVPARIRDYKCVQGRVLREDVFSDMDMPPFDKSAVDGFACRSEDIKSALKIIEVVAAGSMPQKKVRRGECIKIMTGAPVPEGADTVIMVEDTEEIAPQLIRYQKEKSKSNIAYKAEDIKKGDLVLHKSTILQPKHIAVLATVGATQIKVAKKIKVTIISTGDELVEPHSKPAPSQIRNSNAYQLLAQVQAIGAKAKYAGIAKDNEKSTRKILNKAFKNSDIILLSGGVSMGDYDFVPKILNELKVRILFDSIAVQPGRPTVFGIRHKQYIFGLPGNPVSSFVQFELLVKPLIYKLMGAKFTPPHIKLEVGKDIFRKNTKRMSWKPVKIENGKVYPLEYHGSAHINSLSSADAIVAIPIGKTTLSAGQFVDIRLI